MDKTYNFHKLNNNTETCLLEISKSAIIYVGTEDSSTNDIIILGNNGYQQYGYLNVNLNIYYDSTNRKYYITRPANSSSTYYTIKVSPIANNGYSKMNYNTSFDNTGLTLLSRTNLNMPIKRVETNINANELFEYTSINTNQTNQVFGSIIIMLIRNTNATYSNSVIFLNKRNSGTVNTYDTTSISSTGAAITQWNLTGTTTGFSLLNESQGFKVKILEIAAGLSI